MTTNDNQPVILLSPPPPQRPTPTISISTTINKPFASLSRKLSSLSLRSSPPSPRPGDGLESPCTDHNGFLLLPNSSDDNHSIKTTSSRSSSLILSPSISSSTTTCTTPIEERAQPYVILQDKYKNHKKGKIIGTGATAKLRILEPLYGSGGKKTLVAIKTFRKRDSKDETRKGYDKRMTSEFCISKTLCHQHVVKVFDLLKDKKGRWCTVMEYVS
jgi:hypothetical protein